MLSSHRHRIGPRAVAGHAGVAFPMLYQAFRPVLALHPEVTNSRFGSLDLAAHLGVARWLLPAAPESPVTAMGLAFPNRVGVAAGSTRTRSTSTGSPRSVLTSSAIITPRPQPAMRPRLFRLGPWKR